PGCRDTRRSVAVATPFRQWLFRSQKRTRRGPAPFPKRYRPPLGLEALESRYAPAATTFNPGAYIIDMGQPTQTVGNALKPYGLVYDLVTNYKVPVDWAIKSTKTTFAFNNPAASVDFTASITSGSGPVPKDYS